MELIEKRTRSSKTHHLGGRKYAWDGTIGSIHYEDNGWQEIDNIFEPAVAPWDWEMLKAGYHIRVKEDFTAGQIIEFEKQGETVQFQPMALEWTNDLDQIQPISMPQDVIPVITNPEVDLLPAVGVPSHQGTIRWDDAYGEGIDFEWKCTPSRLIKILEVESFDKLSIPEQYILDGGNPVLRLNLIFDPPSKQDVDIYVDGEVWDRKAKKQTFNVIEFRKDGEVLWGFMPLMFWGFDNKEGQSVATLEKRGNKLYISIRVPYEWLQSAVYPVLIDTTIDVQVAASADDGYTREDTSGYDNTATVVYAGEYWASGKEDQFWARFDNITISAGATIGTSYVSAYVDYKDTGNAEQVFADDQSDPSAPSNYADHRGRTRTTAGSAAWVLTAIGNWFNSPSITAVIQELVNSYNYSAGDHAIQILVDRHGDCTAFCGIYARSYDHTGNLHGLKLHIEYSVAGGQDYPISLSPGLTASATVAYAVAWDRGTSPGLTVSITIARSLGRLITTTANLTVSSTVARAMTYAKAITSNLTVSITVVKSWGRIITTTANLVISTTLTRLRNRTIIASPGLTASATVDRDLAYGRATSPGLTASVSISRALAFTKSIASNLTISATVIRIVGKVITTSANLAVSTTISRAVAYNRSLQPALSTAVTILRKRNRTITTTAGLTVSATISIVLSISGRIIQILSKLFRSDLTINSNLTKDVTITSNLRTDLTISSKLEGG